MSDYPDIGMRCDIRPTGRDNRSVSVDQAGGIYTVDLGATDAWQVDITHPLLDATDCQTLRDFYDAHKNQVVQLTYNGIVYDLTFSGPYAENFESAVYTTLKATLYGNRV